MARVICINNKPVLHPNGICSTGDGLTEGEIYTAFDEIFIHPNNKKDCYLIAELNELKLVTRFIPVSDIDETEFINRKEKTETAS